MKQRVPSAADSAALIVTRLSDRIDAVSDTIQQYLLSAIPELREYPQLLTLLHDSVAHNIETVFSAIQHDIAIDDVRPPPTAVEYARQLARRGAPANALIRAYRLGQQTLLGIVLDEIRVMELDTASTLDVFQEITAVTFRYIDHISQQVTAAYQVERELCLATQNTARAMRVRELLDPGPVDIDEAGADIGYALRRTHLAVVVSYSGAAQGDELARLERFVRALAESLDSQGAPLFIAGDRMTGWAWIPVSADTDGVQRARRFAEGHKQSPFLSLGDPLPGVDGFRRSHRQALDAHAVVAAAGTRVQSVVAYGDQGLSAVALHTENLAAAKVWVGEVLGPLASATESDERLRDTLRVFLQNGSSYKAAAVQLCMHFNTVRYRVQRAEDRRGRPITTTDRLDVELALLLCHWFSAAVTTD
ncbi:helix-turn-helix domain-containing protein [Mycolicibacterium sp. 050232]|uniref:PucR family transcriptional regulator n=1 Tax=Mycolicibacterium sp. 050232 TaxID=3113982 RepID=UPI002E2D3DDC|nr:helix-turn-helix domain-containing protein [Mycolicibacterium sp. 050232]MED5810962.1 helix-turn-helix domain-containing protein [Mycolicibacterium sp. 050232]